ncbi:MAG: hypothetical protein GF393_08060 [Armatimonadia bacterium]|nr:hypothetical protein [Armatimonadia bacterium]
MHDTAPEPAADGQPWTSLSFRQAAWALVVAVGLLVAANLFILRYDLEGGRSYGISDVPPAVPWFLLLVILLGSAALRRVSSRLSLNNRQALLVFGFLALAIPLSGFMGVRSLLPHLSLLQYYAAPDNEFSRIADHIPDHLMPKDASVIIPAYEGSESGQVMWGAWLGPVAMWGLLMLVLGLGTLCWITLLRHYWNRTEHLSYPMLEMPRQFVGAGVYAHHSVPFLRDPLMWVGFALAVIFHLGDILKYFNPAIPAVPARTDLAPLLTEGPLRHLLPLRFYISPLTIGAAYLVPQQVLFSVWAIYLLYKVAALIGGSMGIEARGAFPFYQEQATGGYVAYGLLLVWGAREHLAKLWRMALRPRGAGETYPLTPTVALAGVAGSAVFVLGWCYINQFTLKLAAPYFLILLLYVTVQARIRAETGVPLQWDYPFGTQKTIFRHVLGTEGIMSVGGEKGLVMLSYYSWLARYNFLGHTAAYEIDDMTLWEEQHIDAGKAASFMVVALVLGIALGFAIHLKAYYDWGASLLQGGALYGGANTMVARAEYLDLSAQLLAPAAADATRTKYIALGFVLVPVLVFVRRAFLRFPFHPLGFLLATCYGPTPYYWSSFFLAWIAKTLVLQIGGAGTYRRLVPLFLGVVLGSAMAYDVVWMIVRALLPEGMVRGYV